LAVIVELAVACGVIGVVGLVLLALSRGSARR